MLAYVLNAGWYQLGISAITFHDQFCPPPPPAPALPSVPGLVEGPMFLGAGLLGGKTAPTVLVDGHAGVQQGHDIGALIPHFAVPLNALCLVHTGLSKHKVMIRVSSVLLEGKPVGTYFPIALMGLICSNPVSIPAGLLIRTQGTVETSVELADVLRGLRDIAFDMAMDYLWNMLKGTKAFKNIFSSFGTGLRAALSERTEKELVEYGSDTGIEELNKILKRLGEDSIPKMKAWRIVDKVFQSLLKGWVASPFFGGLAHFSPGLGRGKTSWKPFGKEWW